jgi:hypothetical protein
MGAARKPAAGRKPSPTVGAVYRLKAALVEVQNALAEVSALGLPVVPCEAVFPQDMLAVYVVEKDVHLTLEKQVEALADAIKLHRLAKGEFEPGELIATFPTSSSTRPAWKEEAITVSKRLALVEKRTFSVDRYENEVKSRTQTKETVGVKVVPSALFVPASTTDA